jgi:hypothetical protein
VLGNKVGDEAKKGNGERFFVIAYRVIKVRGNSGNNNVICKRLTVLDIEGFEFFG